MRKILTLCILGILLLFNTALAQQTQESVLTLNEVIQIAKENNPEIKSAQQVWRSYQAKIPQAFSLDNPQVSLMYEDISGGPFNLGSSMVKKYTLTQMIPFPTKLFSMKNMVSQEKESFYQQYEAKNRDILAKVKSAFYEYYLAQKKIDINRENKGILERFARIAQAKYAVGKVSQQDVLKANVELALLTNELINLEQEKQIAQAMLNTLLSRPPQSTLPVPADFQTSPVDLKLEELQKITLENRPELKAMDFMVKKSQIDYSLSKQQYLPDLMFRLTRASWTGNYKTWDVEFGFSIPLWFFSKQNFYTQEKKSQTQSARADYQTMKNMVLFEVQDASVKVQTAERSIKLYKNSIIAQAEQSLQAAIIGYETEKIDFLSLLEAQRALKEINLQYYEALVAYQQSLANLEKAIGVDFVKY